jgi:hypothetical protein
MPSIFLTCGYSNRSIYLQSEESNALRYFTIDVQLSRIDLRFFMLSLFRQ